MDSEIQELRRKKFTIEQIAERLGITVGQVKYRIYKKGRKPEPIRQNESCRNVRPASEKRKENPLPPLYYGQDELILMVQNPTTLYTYWEITWPLMNMLADFFGAPYEQLERVLRIYDVTDIWFDGHNAHWIREVFIDSQADNWFVYGLAPGRTFIAELGVRWQGRFIPLLRSHPKATPPDDVAGECCDLVPVVAEAPYGKTKPRWFENFATYTIY